VPVGGDVETKQGMEFRMYKCTGILHQEILQNINFVNIVFILPGERE